MHGQPQAAPGGRLTLFATIFGIALMAGVFIPDSCFFSVANRLANPFALQVGIWILKSCLAIEGALCLTFAKTGYRYVPIEAPSRALAPESPSLSDIGIDGSGRKSNIADLSKPAALGAMVVITLLAAILRCWQMNSGLWLDEVTPLIAYRSESVVQLMSVYLSTNNHLLYTILEKWLTGAFGESEWVVRLPAVVLGIATVPLSYIVARLVMNRRTSVAAALIVATSFHLVFFSQNARGYSGFLFFSLGATVCFVRALQKDRLRDWIGYALCMVLNVAFLLGPSIAVLAAHMFIGVASLVVVARRGQPVQPLMLRTAAVLALTCLLMLQLYSLIFPQSLCVLESTYSQPSTGFSLFSPAFVQETLRGLSAGYSGLLLIGILPALIVLGAGVKSLWRKNWLWITALILPQILLAGFMGVLKLAVSPRFFILALPVAIFIAVQGLETVCAFVCAFLKRPKLARVAFSAAVSIVLIGTAPSLARYYAVPKQDFKSGVQYMKNIRVPGQILVPIYTARGGFAYYAEKAGLRPQVDYQEAKEPQDFQAVLATHAPAQILIMTTFSRALHMDHPQMEQQIARDWQIAKVFAGTIGDGAVTVWTPKTSPVNDVAKASDSTAVHAPGNKAHIINPGEGNAKVARH